MGIRELFDKYKEKKSKYAEAKENMEIAEKLERSKKSGDEIYLEKHYARLRQEKLKEMAHKIQRQEGMSMIDTKIPKSKNTLQLKMKLCSDGVKL